MRKFITALLCCVVLVGCQDAADEAPQKPTAGAAEHNTLGIWPNVVIVNADPEKAPKIDDQKTAADILYDILAEAVMDADDPKLGPAKFKTLVDLIARCGRNVNQGPGTISAHTVKILAALESAKKHTAQGWDDCLADMGHGH